VSTTDEHAAQAGPTLHRGLRQRHLTMMRSGAWSVPGCPPGGSGTDGRPTARARRPAPPA